MAHIKNAANFTKNKKRGGAQAYIVSVLTRVLPMVERSKLRTTCCFGWTRWTLQPASKLLQARSELERHSYFKIWIFWKTGARLLKFLFVDIKLVRSNLRSSLEGPASGAGSGAGYRSRRRRVVSSSKKNQTKRYNITTTVIYTQLLNNGLNKRDRVCDSVMVARLPALPLLLLSTVLNAQLALVISTAETVTASVPSSPSSYSSSQSQLKYE